MTENNGFFGNEIQDDLKQVEDLSTISSLFALIEKIQQHTMQFDQIIYVQNQRIEQLHNLVSLIISRDPELSKIITEYGKKQGITDDKTDQ